MLYFGEDPNPNLDLRIFQVILHHWGIGPNTIHRTISQKVGDGFRWNLVDSLGEPLGSTGSILVKIWIRIWGLFNFKWLFSIERSGQKRILHDIIKSCGWIQMKLGGQVGFVTRMNWINFWICSEFGSGSENCFEWYFSMDRWVQNDVYQDISRSYNKTMWVSWFGDNNKPIRFWLRIQIQIRPGLKNPDSDPTYQWDNKFKLSSLAEVCAPPSEAPFHQVSLFE